jgi:hypothetical protein
MTNGDTLAPPLCGGVPPRPLRGPNPDAAGAAEEAFRRGSGGTRMVGTGLFLLALGIAPPVRAQGDGREIRLDVARDTWLSNVGPEADGSNGAAPRLKAKSIQEMSLIDVDTSRLKGRVIESATLHLKSAGEPRLRRITVSTVAAPWVEGTATSYEHQPGSSTHNHRVHPDVPWTLDGGDLCRVILGQGGTIWSSREASPPDREGWQAIAVAPEVIAARAAGIGEGFLVFDDTGSEWSRDGDKFTYKLFPNRFVFSKDSNRSSAPYLTVRLGAEDRRPPATPGDLEVDANDLPAGEAWASWTTPRDDGPSGTIGFVATVDGRPIPRYLIPPAGPVGGRERIHLRDLNLAAGATVRLSVRAVDAAGNIGPAAEDAVKVSARRPKSLPADGPKPSEARGNNPKLGGAEVAIVDELDKVDPVRGTTIPATPDGYLTANRLWNARENRIRLHAARNEFVAFQIVVRDGRLEVTPSLTFSKGAAPRVEFGRYGLVPAAGGPLPDPIVPLASARRSVQGRTSQSLHAELYVSHDAEAGEHEGALTLKSGAQTLAIDVTLTVWDFTLPDSLSFLPEMNCYDLPDDERSYYRLAHTHRTVLNRVPYHHNGRVADGFAPRWDGKTLGWEAWDRRFGPLLDGSAFADLPRKGVPLECFYLPMFENWPTPMEENYNGSYWADEAFPERYRRAFVEVARQFAAHANANGWDDTFFQCYFNGKIDFKRNGWSRGTCPWLLDEPANFQDYWALRYFGRAFHEGVSKAPGPAKLVFRADISRPEWQRDVLDGVLDYNVVGGAFRRYRRLVFDRKEAQGQVALEYGSANAVEDSNVQPAVWSLDIWSLGLDGVLPWQTIGDAGSWDKADALSLLYPPRPGDDGPIPSIRLKAFRRGQQDVEYLTLYALATGEPRWAVGQRVREALGLVAQRKGTGSGGEDAGVMHYGRLRPGDLWALRTRVGRALSAMKPAPKAKIVDLRTPPREGR